MNAPRRELFSASRMAKIRHHGEERRPYKDFTESRAEEAVVASRRARQAGFGGAMEDIKRHIAPVKDAIEPILERLMTKKSRKRFLERAGPALLVVTFIEDGLRIVLRWSEQMHYMTQVMGMCAPRTIPRARRAKFRARRPSPLILTAAARAASSQELVPRRPSAHLLGGRPARRGVARDAPRAHQAVARQARLLRAPRLRRPAAVHVRPGARRRLHVRGVAPFERGRTDSVHRLHHHRFHPLRLRSMPASPPARGRTRRPTTRAPRLTRAASLSSAGAGRSRSPAGCCS